MHTHRLGQVAIDEHEISKELKSSLQFHFAEQYPEFQSGRPWKSCMLWSCGGEVGDGVIAHYDTGKAGQPTEYGEQLPYLMKIIDCTFHTQWLLFARLVVMTDNVLVPHRDYLEFSERAAGDRAGHRLHIPLATSTDCLFMEDNTVYRMPFGEIWSLDVTRMHSAAVLSDVRRVHLILDFADVDDGTALVKLPVEGRPGIPEELTVGRPVLSQRERTGILGLSDVVDSENLTDIFGIVIRKHYRADGGDKYVWDTMRSIAQASGHPDVQARVDKLYHHCTLVRAE